MKPVCNELLLKQLKWRYATKKFDATKKINAEDWMTLEQALILTPSSFGLQPWKFVVVTKRDIKEKLVAASWNQAQVVECSHHVVFTVRTSLTNANVDEYIHSISETRGQALDNPSLVGLKKMLESFIAQPDFSVKTWAALQAYIALGNLMTTAALMGIDACPMEGIDPAKYDEILKVSSSGYATTVACALGYRAADDKYADLAKVRYPASKVIQHVS